MITLTPGFHPLGLGFDPNAPGRLVSAPEGMLPEPRWTLAYRIAVYGLPAPQGSKKFLGLAKSGRGILGESSKKVKPWREAVKAAAMAVRDKPPIDAPVRVCMTFTLPKPSGAPKRRRTFPMRTPDLSKLVRSTEDALTDAGIWRDDARVIEAVTGKAYPGERLGALDCPGAYIEVYVLEGAA